MPSPRDWLLVAVIACAGAQAADEVRILVQNSPLAGFRYHEAGAVWDELRVGDRLELVAEPHNPHDVDAIAIAWRGRKLGYLPRAENRTVASALAGGRRLEARIAHLRPHPNPRQRIGIDIYVVP